MTLAYQSWNDDLLVGVGAVGASLGWHPVTERRSKHKYAPCLNGLAAVGLGAVPVGLVAAIWSTPVGAAFAGLGFILIHVTGSLAAQALW